MGSQPRSTYFKGLDGTFHVLDWGGQGPLVHLSHATGFCAGVYHPFAQILRSDLRIVGMDDRGHGTTRAPADPGKLKGWHIFSQDLERLFESLAPP